jgi:glycosyltransferase involved in cell wall biosynthesis
VLDLLYRITFSVCEGIFFQNTKDPALLQQRGVLPTNITFQITNGSGVDTEHFCPEPLPEQPTFLCLARLIPEKGVREYAAAAKKVKRQHPNSSFLLAGHMEPNVPDAITEDEIQDWVNEGIIDYRGYVEDVRPLMAQTSTYVLPTYYREGTPRSILEAMSMGRPIITTDAPGCAGTVENKENGWIVSPRDSNQLADAMRWMISHPDQVEQMGMKSRKRATKKYDVDKVNKTIMSEMGII